MSGSTFLYPEVPALVQVDAQTLSITNLWTGWRCESTGVVADAARAVLDGTTTAQPTVLSALGEQHALQVALSLLERQRRLELTPTTALTLGKLDTLFVEVTGACNERCVHCYAEAEPENSSSLDRQTCSEIIEDAVALEFRRVQLTGGEPLLCPFIVDLAAEVDSSGMICEVYTNGLLLDDALLGRLGADRVQLAFSFYAHDPTIHDAITRHPGSQQQTVAAIKRAVAAGFTVRVGVVVMHQNAASVPETLAFIRSLGVTSVSAVAAHGVGRGSYFAGDWRHDDEQAAANDDSSPRAPRQLSGKLCVGSDGSVLPCIFNRSDLLGSIHERRLTEIVADPQLPAPRPDQQLSDRQRQLQCQECRLTALALRACARSRFQRADR